MRNPNGPLTGRPPVRAERGMVATPHYLASATGLDVLRRGGSAADAAIAANAVLCVAYPHMTGLGGDGFALVHRRGHGIEALNASGPAAALATRDWYRERGHTDAIPSRGPLAALTVPGAVEGWRALHERHGRLDWSALFEDALHLARSGVPVSRSLEEWTTADLPYLEQDDDAATVYLPGGGALREGDRLRNAGLARSLERIAADGARAAFYEGEVGDRLCAALEAKGSPLRADDLAGFRAQWVEPIQGRYRGLDVHELPPNTQGFTALQVLGMLDGIDVAALGEGTADYYHHAAEAVKLAFADRDTWLTDPDHVDIPLDRLLDPAYLSERRGLIDPDRAMVMADAEPGVAGPGAVGERSPEGDTVYLCAVDSDGMAVSMIQSIYHDYGSAVVGGDTGILVQNRGSFFSLDDHHPNRLEPGKRSFHTLVPALVTRGGELDVVLGTMGGEGQPQSKVAMLTRLVDFGFDVQQAIEAPRWLMGRTWGTASQELSLEGRIPDPVVRELERRGQPVKMLADWDDNMGHAAAIRLDHEHGFLEGGADPRGDGLALGF